MNLMGVKCGKCGLIQMAKETCKSCGSPLMDPMNPNPTPSKSSGQKKVPAAKSEKAPAPALVDAAKNVSPEQAPNGEGDTHKMTYLGAGGSLFGIYIMNAMLSMITLGIYSFWGRVEVRKYLMSQTEFHGDRLAYHGSGKELLLGFLKAALVFGVPMILLTLVRDVFDVGEAVKILAGFVSSLFVLFLIPFATVSARRYRLSRTSWRGIRFSFRGRVWEFCKIFVVGLLLTVVTFGLYYPFFAVKKYSFLASHSYFGNRNFHFTGSGKDLFGSFLLALVLTIPTFGFYWFWFSAKMRRYFVNGTSIGENRFESSVTGGALLLLALGNMCLMMVTLGIGYAWIVTRKIKFTYRYLTVKGPIDVDEIVQQAELAPATGEELAGFFDLDAGFDIG